MSLFLLTKDFAVTEEHQKKDTSEEGGMKDAAARRGGRSGVRWWVGNEKRTSGNVDIPGASSGQGDGV